MHPDLITFFHHLSLLLTFKEHNFFLWSKTIHSIEICPITPLSWEGTLLGAKNSKVIIMKYLLSKRQDIVMEIKS